MPWPVLSSQQPSSSYAATCSCLRLSALSKGFSCCIAVSRACLLLVEQQPAGTL